MKNDEVINSILKTYRKKIWKKFLEAINKYHLIEEGDKIAVCISGGKDSFLMALCFKKLQKISKYHFEVVNVVMDPGYKKEIVESIKKNASLLDIDIHIFKSDIFKVSTMLNQDKPCYMCARMRRGFLYSRSQEMGCNKIALGHHFDDVIETVLLNIFYGGVFKTMMPKLKSKNFENMELIRPLYLVKEEDIIRWKKYNDLEFINCACRMTEKLSDSSKRLEMKILIKNLREKYENIDINILRSTEEVNTETILSYIEDDKIKSVLDK